MNKFNQTAEEAELYIEHAREIMAALRILTGCPDDASLVAHVKELMSTGYRSEARKLLHRLWGLHASGVYDKHIDKPLWARLDALVGHLR